MYCHWAYSPEEGQTRYEVGYWSPDNHWFGLLTNLTLHEAIVQINKLNGGANVKENQPNQNQVTV